MSIGMSTGTNAAAPALGRRPRRASIGLELSKMRRLRTVPVAAALAAATVALSAANLFSASARAGFSSPDSRVWEELLLNYTLMSAITGPILAAVLASRQTDIEHSGAGWTLFATAGRTPGALCRAKVVALSLVIAPAITCQSLALVGSARLAGVAVPLSPGPWALYTAGLIGPVRLPRVAGGGQGEPAHRGRSRSARLFRRRLHAAGARLGRPPGTLGLLRGHLLRPG